MFFTPFIFLAVVMCFINKYTERKQHEEFIFIQKENYPYAYFDNSEQLHVHTKGNCPKKENNMLRACPNDTEEIDLTYASQ